VKLEVGDKYKTLSILPVETDSIEFVPVNNPNLLLGHLFTSAHSHTSEVVDLPQKICINTKIEFRVATRYTENVKCSKGGCQVSTQLKTVTGNVIIGEVKDRAPIWLLL